MFNNYHSHTKHVTERVTENVNITEKRAPTDESVKLLREFQDKALEDLLSKVTISDNLVNGHILVLNHSVTSLDCQVCFKFNLNGKEFTDNVVIQRSEIYSLGVHANQSADTKLIQLLYKKLSERITELLLNSNDDFMRGFISQHR